MILSGHNRYCIYEAQKCFRQAFIYQSVHFRKFVQFNQDTVRRYDNEEVADMF